MSAADDAVTGNGTTDEVHDEPAVLSDPEPIEATATERPPVEVVEVQPEPEAPREPDPAPENVTGTALAVADPDERRHFLVPGRDMPLIPEQREMMGLASMAVTLAGANAVPAALRNAPNDVFQVLLTARDQGVAVTTAMREFHVIDGRVTMSPKVKLAMVHERGQREGWKVWACTPEFDLESRTKRPCWVCGSETGNDAVRAAWHATRADLPGSVFTSEFTMEMARNAGTGKGSAKLADKDNWKSYPQRMLSWRALGYLLDDVFPEVGTGLYSPDELGAMTDEDGRPIIDLEVAEPLPGTKAPRGHGPKPPDPRDQLLSEAEPDTVAGIRERIEALPEAAVAVLKELWTEPQGEDETPRLPPLPHCQVRHRAKVLALLASIEKRAEKGEWGDPPAADAEPPSEPTAPADGSGAAVTPDDAPEASSGDDSAATTDDGRDAATGICPDCFATPQEPHHDGCAVAVPPTNAPLRLPTPPEPTPVSIPEQVKAMELGEVLRQLDERKDSPLIGDNLPGSPKAQRALLVVLLEAEAHAAANEGGEALPLD